LALRFAKWKRDAQFWFIQESLRQESLLSRVADDLVRARWMAPNVTDYGYRLQAQGIDRPSFGATLLKSRDKYHLTEREQAWLVGDMLYIP